MVRCTKCDLEDWDLDKGAEFSNTGVGSRNSVTALTLTALLEVSIVWCIPYNIYLQLNGILALFYELVTRVKCL